MFAWFGTLWNPILPDPVAKRSATSWLQSGMKGKPPAGATATEAFLYFLRTRFEPVRVAAANEDPTTRRRFGLLDEKR